MQRSITNKVHLGQTDLVDPADNTGKVRAVYCSSDFEGINKQMNKLNKKFRKTGVMDADIQENLPAMLPIACQGIIYACKTKNSTT